MPNTIILDGSHGEVRVHRATGVVVEAVTSCSCEDCAGLPAYVDQLFDANDLATLADCGSADVLWVGSWDRQGRYAPAITHRTAWSEKWGEDFDAVADKALLPAPNVEIILHGFYTDEEGNDTFSDREEESTGWCVYLRRNNPTAWGDFDIDWERDFETYEAASDFAKKWAAAYGIEIFEQT